MGKKKVKEKKEHNSLILFNCQYDFLDESSLKQPLLKIKEGFVDHLIEKISSIPRINHIVFIRDMYNKKNPELKKNGGEIPEHCISGTKGAEIDNRLYDFCKELVTINGIDIVDIHTSLEHEDIGAFTISNNFSSLSPKEEPHPKHCYFSNADGECGVRFMNNNLYIMGINYMNAIEDSIDNLMKSWKFNIHIDKSDICSDDDFKVMRECANDYKEHVEFNEDI